MFKFDLQLFGGIFGGDDSSSTQTTVRNIPNETAEEAQLKNGLMSYNTTGLNNAASILSKAISSINDAYTPGWSTLANNYNNTMSGVNSGYSTLANGELPTAYATARQKALNSDLQGTVGNSISSLANRGILNSSVTNNALNNISQNASDTLAKNYLSDLTTQANLLNSQASNAADTLSGNATAQSASYVPASSLFSYASQLATPAQNMWGTMYSGRMNSAGSTTTTNTSDNGKGSLWSGIGQLGAAAITKGV